MRLGWLLLTTLCVWAGSCTGSPLPAAAPAVAAPSVHATSSVSAVQTSRQADNPAAVAAPEEEDDDDDDDDDDVDLDLDDDDDDDEDDDDEGAADDDDEEDDDEDYFERFFDDILGE